MKVVALCPELTPTIVARSAAKAAEDAETLSSVADDNNVET